jgi:hypothetical protein
MGAVSVRGDFSDGPIQGALKIVFFYVRYGHVVHRQRPQSIHLPVGVQGMPEEVDIGRRGHVEVCQTIDPTFHAKNQAILRCKDRFERSLSPLEAIV